MTFPTFIDEVAFASDPLASPQVYTDISGRASVRTFGRGRQSEGDTPDTGTSTQTFENSDRALDPHNAASPYYPNVKPMRRTRCRVAEVLPADAGPLTASGNEVNDATRAQVLSTASSGQMMDGRANDSSFGIRRAATNLFRRGQCDATTDWNGAVGGEVRTVDATVAPPFSTQSVKVVCDGTLANQGLLPTTATGQAAAAGTLGVGSVLFRGVAGQSYRTQMRWINTDATVTDGAQSLFTAGSGAWPTVTIGGLTWEVLAPAAATVAVGKTGNNLAIHVRINGTRAETFWVAHAMLESGQAVVAPYVATSGGATAGHAAGRVQAPSALLSTAQGWAAFRMRMGYASTATLASSVRFFSWGDSGSERLLGLYASGTPQFQLFTAHGGSNVQVNSATQAFAAGDLVTVVIAWDASKLYVSVNGGPFVSANRTNGIQALAAATFSIGADFGGSLQIDSDVLWSACGTGKVTDADAASMFAMGNTAKDASDLLWGSAADVSMVWQAATTTYRVPSDAILFTNFIDPEQGWQLAQVGPAQMNAIAPANDAFDLLGTFKFDAFASFPQQYAGQRVAAILDAYGWPAAERDLDLSTNGQSQVQAAAAGSLKGASALDAIQAAAANDNGVFYIDGRGFAVFRGRHRQTDSRYTTSQAVFTDKANWLPGYYLYDPGLTPAESPIRNDYRVTRAGGTQMTWSDPTSILHYGDRTKEADTLHISDAEALNYAQYRVALDKDPHRRYDEMTVTPGDDASFWLLVLSLQLGDRVTVIQSPPGGGSPDVRDMHIEAISAQIGPAATAQWTYRLSPADDQVGWVLGDAVYGLLGSTTALTY